MQFRRSVTHVAGRFCYLCPRLHRDQLRTETLVGCLALVAACGGESPPVRDEIPLPPPKLAVDSVTSTLQRFLGDAYDIEHCMFDSTAHHADGIALLEDFVRRARTGAFDHTESWMPTAFLCPGVEPGYDTFYVLDGVSLEFIRRGADSVSAVLRSEQLGYESSGYFPERGMRADTLTAYRTRYGWRLRGGFWNWVDRDEAVRRGWLSKNTEASSAPRTG